MEDFLRKEHPKLVSYVRKQASFPKASEAEDLVQDVIVRILEGTLNPVENLAAYVYRSLDHRLTDYFRKKESTEVSFDGLQESAPATMEALLADLRFDTQAKMEEESSLQKLYQAIDRLPDDQKAVLIATEFEEWTFAELAEVWDEPIGTLLSRKNRAVKNLRKYLTKE